MKKDYLAEIKSFYKKCKRLPSYSEMLKMFDISSKNTIYRIITKLIEDGVIKKENGKLAPTPKFFSLPLLGLIKAGYPILSEENKSYLTLDEYLIDDPNSSFLLKVSGDSMINAGIFEGDLVIIEKKEAINGDIVLAEIDREWTLKYLKKEKQITYLEAANEKYPRLVPKQELKIYGVVKAVIRKLHS
jgi:SOS regulatory protein LexA